MSLPMGNLLRGWGRDCKNSTVQVYVCSRMIMHPPRLIKCAVSSLKSSTTYIVLS